MKEKIKNNRGITIVVLVVTIILLLILAGISIQAITNTGIFSNAKRAELENKRAQISEALQVRLITEQSNNPFGNSEEIISATRENVTENIDEIKQFGKDVIVGEISTEEDFKKVDVYFYVIVDGDLYKVELNGVSFIGKIDEMPPVINMEKITNTTNSITVEVTTKRNEGGKLEYYIKSEDEEDYRLIKTSNEENYTYEGLEQGKKYSVKVRAVAKNTKTAEVIGEQETGKVVELITANAKFTYSPNTWTNGDVVATVTTDVTGFTIQTSKDGQTWEDTASQTMSSNGPVYARLWDGVNAGEMLTGSVTNIDKNKPAISRTITQGDNGMNVGGAYTNGEWAYYWRTCYLNVRFTCSDNIGITGYYWGTTKPTSIGSVSWTPVSSVTSYSIAQTIGIVGTAQPSISRSETYYFAVRDAAGNFEVNTTSTYEQCVYHKTVASFTTSYKALANPGGYNYFVASFVNSGTTMYYTYGGVTSSVREAGVGNILTVNGGNAQICFSNLPGVNTSYYYIYFK